MILEFNVSRSDAALSPSCVVPLTVSVPTIPVLPVASSTVNLLTPADVLTLKSASTLTVLLNSDAVSYTHLTLPTKRIV